MHTSHRATTLAQQGSIAEAFRMLTHAAEAGDVEAAYTLAGWRMAGQIIRRDLGEARRLYGLAAAGDFRDSVSRHIAMLANGAGGSGRKWQQALSALKSDHRTEFRRQLELLNAMDLDEEGNPRSPPRPEPVRKDPPIWVIRDILTPDECAYLIELTEPRLQPSVVIHPKTGEFVSDPVRKSSAAGYPFVLENPVIHAINRRIAAVTDTTYEQGEPVQVLAYKPGEEYKTHSDAIAGEDNQRILTLLVYLNDGYSGGETRFDKLDWQYKGGVGDALIFSSVDEAGRPHLDAFHSGQPVGSGRKVVLSKWIRRYPLSLEGPPGKPF